MKQSEKTKKTVDDVPQQSEDINVGKTVDELLDSCKVVGRGQLIIHLSMCYISLTVTGHVVLSFFTGHSPSWRLTR